MNQALCLNTKKKKKNLKIDKIIDIYVDERIIAKRIISRFKTENRQDDTEDVIKTRISRYLSETKPLSDFYKTKYPSDYLVINGNQEIEKVAVDIIKILKREKI
jgi:adenylate kinase